MQKIAGGIAPHQNYTHLFSARLKFNLFLGLEVFYLQADNKALYRNSIFLVFSCRGEDLSHCGDITDQDLNLPELPTSPPGKLS